MSMSKIKTISALAVFSVINPGIKEMCTAAFNVPYYYNGHIAFPLVLVACDCVFRYAIRNEKRLDNMQYGILLTELVYVGLFLFANFKNTTLPIWLSSSVLLINLLIRCYDIKNQPNNKHLQLIGFILLYIL